MAIKFTDEQVQEITTLAMDGCQNGTIAHITGIANTTLIRRFGKLLTKKRCERKHNLRKNQTNLSENNPAMAIFLGKNELGQVDKQTIQTESTDVKPKTAKDLRAAQAAAKAYNEAMSKTDDEPQILSIKGVS